MRSGRLNLIAQSRPCGVRVEGNEIEAPFRSTTNSSGIAKSGIPKNHSRMIGAAFISLEYLQQSGSSSLTGKCSRLVTFRGLQSLLPVVTNGRARGPAGPPQDDSLPSDGRVE